MDKQPTYEEAFQEIQEIIRRLQEEQIGVEELAEKVERAAALIELCRQKLRTTEDRIGKLFEE